MCVDATLNWHEDVHQSATWGRSMLTLFRWMIWSTLEPILACRFQTHVVRKIVRERFYFPSALVVCVSHPCFENRLACDCLCHFVKFGVILGDLKSRWRENSNCDGDIPFLQTFQWAGRGVIRWNLHNSSLFSFSLFTCSFVSPSLPWILKKKLHFFEVCTRHRREPPPSRNDYYCGVYADYVDIWHVWMTLSTNKKWEMPIREEKEKNNFE